MRSTLFCLFFLITSANAFEYWPGAEYDASIPTVNEVLGYASGDRITWHRDTLRYFEALEAAAPDRVRITRYGSTWEGRDLIYVIVTAPGNLSRIDAIKENMQRLRDPAATSRADAERIFGDQPAITWLSYGVHGNEISSTDAAMLTAYHLLAATNDPRVDDILENTVVIIDPMQNPDGRDRFIQRYETAKGLLPDPDRLSAEQNEPWPSGRTNHYLFDMNRDWFMMTQPETQGRVRAVQEFYPVAFVDLHEMGSDSTYYFAPEAIPYNPHLASDQRAGLELFGKTNAGWFDKFGMDYFTREVYDAFYPGYGASWPSYFGSIAMTYEQASSRGLVVRKYDGVEMPYRETVRGHFVTSLGTAETVASNRRKFLEEFYEYQVSAIAEGEKAEIRAYIVPRQQDQAGADKLAGLLVRQGVRVARAETAFRACDRDYTAGSYVVDLAQPAKRLVRTLLDANVPLDEDFTAEQERRRAKALPDEIYDVTAWSLPLMMNVEVDSCGRAVTADLEPAGPDLVTPGAVSGPADAVAYLVPWGEAPAIRLLGRAHREGLAVKSTDEAFTHDGTEYAAGTLIFDAADNPVKLRSMLDSLASETGANVVGVASSWVTDGPNFGSDKVVRMNAPRVAIAWDEPTSQYSAGNTRFVIERQFDYPVTAVRTAQLAMADLRRYHVIILPDTYDGYLAMLGEEGADNLRDWVERGGVLVTVGSATAFAADPAVDLLSIRLEEAWVDEAVTDSLPDEPDAGDGEETKSTVAGKLISSEDEYRMLTTPTEDLPDSVGGVLLRAQVDGDHWLGAGVKGTVHVLARGSDIYTPARLDAGVNVARFEAADDVLASGYLWDGNRRQLAYKPFAVAEPKGNGFVIAFTQDPNVRAYLDGLNVIFMNAIFRGAAHARPLR